jgi:hypothetical protein
MFSEEILLIKMFVQRLIGRPLSVHELVTEYCVMINIFTHHRSVVG